MLNWKDVSSQSKSDKVRTPNSFETHCGQFRLCVHYYHGYGNMWFVSCYPPTLFSQHSLKSTDIKDAKAEATIILKKILTEALEDLNGVPCSP